MTQRRSFTTGLPPGQVASRLHAVIEPETVIARMGGRTSELPFVGSVSAVAFAFRRPGRNSFKPLFLGHIRGAEAGSRVDLEARNLISARRAVVLVIAAIAPIVVVVSLLGSPAFPALAALVFVTFFLGLGGVAISRWQLTEARRIFALIERVIGALTVEEARSIGLTV